MMVRISIFYADHLGSSLFQKGGKMLLVYLTCPTSDAEWFIKDCAICYHHDHNHVIMRVKDLQLSAVRVGHCDPLGGFSLPLYSLHALNKNVNVVHSINQCMFPLI